MITSFSSQKNRLILLIVIPILLCMCGCGPRQSSSNRLDNFDNGMYHHAFLNSAVIDMLYQIRSDIMASAEVRADFRIIGQPEPNAFLTLIDNEPTILLTTGIIALIRDNKDEYAFLIAHECAHLSQNHLKNKKEADAKINTTGSAIITGIEFIGMAVGLPLGLLSLASVESGSHLASLKYDRDQEREADRLALEYMTAAGYDAAGALSFHEKMVTLAKGPKLAIFSTHPPDAERLENIKTLLAEKPSLPPSTSN